VVRVVRVCFEFVPTCVALCVCSSCPRALSRVCSSCACVVLCLCSTHVLCLCSTRVLCVRCSRCSVSCVCSSCVCFECTPPPHPGLRFNVVLDFMYVYVLTVGFSGVVHGWSKVGKRVKGRGRTSGSPGHVGVVHGRRVHRRHGCCHWLSLAMELWGRVGVGMG
jgi:hypothetical protein